jgi:acyl carrier protein
LFRIAPHCEQYHGTDLSRAALDFLSQHLLASGSEFGNVTLSRQHRSDLLEIEIGVFDTIVLNSVVQYFPSADYLVRFIREAVRVIKPGGSIFLGDLRSLPLQRVLHAGVQLHSAPGSMTVSELNQRIETKMAQERELVLDPAFFSNLGGQIPGLGAVHVHLKRASYPNELSKFRYDVTLEVGTGPVPQIRSRALHWQRDHLDLQSLRRQLAESNPDTLIIREVPNSLLALEFRVLSLLDSEFVPQTVGELRKSLQRLDNEPGVNPEDFWSLEAEVPYVVQIRSSSTGGCSCFDVVLRRKDTPYVEVLPDGGIEEPTHHCSYTNNPLRAKAEQSLLPILRRLVKQKLPEHMAPSEFVFVPRLPLTRNGKIDRNALPVPEQTRSHFGALVRPRNDIEEQLVGIWTEILRRSDVGINDNFFEVGGHSLLATQVISRVRERFEIEFPLRRLFEFPTIGELAEAVVQAQRGRPAQSKLPIKSRQRDRAALLENINKLSAEQVDSLLSQVLSQDNGNQ